MKTKWVCDACECGPCIAIVQENYSPVVCLLFSVCTPLNEFDWHQVTEEEKR